MASLLFWGDPAECFPSTFYSGFLSYKSRIRSEAGEEIAACKYEYKWLQAQAKKLNSLLPSRRNFLGTKQYEAYEANRESYSNLSQFPARGKQAIEACKGNKADLLQYEAYNQPVAVFRMG